MADQMEWTIGELASAAGVTVRTLHHYDRIGLLIPDDRSSGGHRRYGADAVERLYSIVALRGLGFGLAEIPALLDADRGRLIETVRRQLRAVDADVEMRKRLRDRLARMLDRLEKDESLSARELIETMEEISMSIKIDRVYTRAGDAGETELAGGTWIAKTDPQLEAGDIEELSAHIVLRRRATSFPKITPHGSQKCRTICSTSGRSSHEVLKCSTIPSRGWVPYTLTGWRLGATRPIALSPRSNRSFFLAGPLWQRSCTSAARCAGVSSDECLPATPSILRRVVT